MFDHPKSADIHLCSAVRTILMDVLSDPLGFHLFFLPSWNLCHS